MLQLLQLLPSPFISLFNLREHLPHTYTRPSKTLVYNSQWYIVPIPLKEDCTSKLNLILWGKNPLCRHLNPQPNIFLPGHHLRLEPWATWTTNNLLYRDRVKKQSIELLTAREKFFFSPDHFRERFFAIFQKLMVSDFLTMCGRRHPAKRFCEKKMKNRTSCRNTSKKYPGKSY